MNSESNSNWINSLAENMNEISGNMTNKSIVKNNSLNPYNDTSINIEEILNYPRNCPYLKTDGSSRAPKMEFLNENSMKLNNTEKDINSYLKEIYKNEFDFSYNKCLKRITNFFVKNALKIFVEIVKIISIKNVIQN